MLHRANGLPLMAAWVTRLAGDECDALDGGVTNHTRGKGMIGQVAFLDQTGGSSQYTLHVKSNGDVGYLYDTLQASYRVAKGFWGFGATVFFMLHPRGREAT